MPDIEEFIALFISEAQERLTKMDSAIVELEKNPNDIELIKQINREAHSLKGSSRAFEFYNIQDITHKLEDIFDSILTEQKNVTPELIEVVFSSLDIIRNILETSDIEKDVSEVCTKLNKCLTSMQDSTEVTGKTNQKNNDIEAKAVKTVSKPKKTVSKPKKTDSTPKKINKEKPKPANSTAVEKKQTTNKEANTQKTKSEPSKKPAVNTVSQTDFIRVPLNKVNTLLDLIGEVTVDRMRVSEKIIDTKAFSQKIKSIQKTFSSLTDTIHKSIITEDSHIDELIGTARNELRLLEEEYRKTYENISEDLYYMDPIIDDLQNRIKDLRMLPCSTVFESYPRMIRDIATKENKKVNLEISGEETELDMKMLEAVKAPLMHIVRNCIDHGIESPEKRKAKGKEEEGNIELKVKIEGAHTVITIQDDGKGIDLDAIKEDAINKKLIGRDEIESMTDDEIMNIIFMSGYSSSKVITDVSGRGIGLDIAKRDIEKLQGQLLVNSTKDKGTIFNIILPITISIFKVILIESNSKTFAVPMASITKCMCINSDKISTIEGRMVLELDEHVVPLVRLSDILQLPSIEDDPNRTSINTETNISIFILSSINQKVGFIVDRIIGDREVFIKHLGNHIGKIENICGAAILENGEAIITLDTTELIVNSTKTRSSIIENLKAGKIEESQKEILIVDDSFSTRELTRNILETHDYSVDAAVDGLDAMDKIAQKKYDLIVTDVDMPRMDGFELCSSIKGNDEFKNIPVIIVTSKEKEEDKKRGIEVGASYYIVKSSFKQETLLETIERLVL